MPDKIPILERIQMCGTFLDKLAEASGRAKCGYIYILNEYLESIRNDVLIMQEQLNDKDNQNGIKTETMST